MNADEMIEKWERETGNRVDANDHDNAAIWGLMGELARAMGKSSHDSRDDVAAGVLLMHGKERDDTALRMFVSLLSNGVDEDTARKLLGD